MRLRVRPRSRWIGTLFTAGVIAWPGCVSNDGRPLVENASSHVLEVRSLHEDGRTLRAVLQPGARVALGIVEAPVDRLEATLEGKPVLELSHADVSACMEAASPPCRGWRLDDEGFTRIEPSPGTARSAAGAEGSAEARSKTAAESGARAGGE